jgi:hypothetical protein
MSRVKNITNSLELKRIQLSNEKEVRNLIGEVKLQNDLLGEVIQSLDKVKESIDSQDYPQPHKTVKISNLKDVKIPELKSVQIEKPTWLKLKQFSLSELISSIGDLFSNLLSREFRVDLEQYRVARNAISVRLSNGKEFLESLNTGIATGMSSIEFPSWISKEETQKSINSKLDTYSLNDVRDNSINSNITYLGKDDKQGNWLIIEINELEGVSMRFATVKNNPLINTYQEAMLNRESLTYDIYSKAF